MKNIHILPTNKPSRVFNTNKGEYHFREHYVPDTIQTCKNHNIYITSDEEIKEGDWVITPTNDILEWAKVFQPIGKKIIITTDQDLINEGVQAINDDFLEWFVKNPTCEEVEIQCRYNFYIGQNLTHYKVIIPKEEPKQETLEEVAKEYASRYGEIDIVINKAVKFGAEWQQERMYSEEEAGELVYNIIGKYAKQYGIMIDGAKLNALFEQFKKKY